MLCSQSSSGKGSPLSLGIQMEKSSVVICVMVALSFFCTAAKSWFSNPEKIETRRVPVTMRPGRCAGAGAPCEADWLLLVWGAGEECGWAFGAVCCAQARAVKIMSISKREETRIKFSLELIPNPKLKH